MNQDTPPEDEFQPGSTPTGLQVALPVFEGPLDLLLHLIRKHEINIFDIPITKILDEYLATLELMRSLNLDVAGEFLVMASTLAQIKSRMLLPEPPASQEEEEPQEDPRAELVRRLLEYQRYQDVAQRLAQRPMLGRDVFTHGCAPMEVAAEPGPPFQELSVYHLILALDSVLRQASARVDHEVLIERISVAQRIQELIEFLPGRKQVSFPELFGAEFTRAQLVVTFLALLEMARLHLVSLQQASGSEILYIINRLETVDTAQALASLGLAEATGTNRSGGETQEG